MVAQNRVGEQHDVGKYSLQTQLQKKTSKIRYPLVSKMAPAAMAMRASPRFWMDCMLIKHQEAGLHDNTVKRARHQISHDNAVTGTYKP